MTATLQTCPNGCGVRHENGVPTRTNCRRWRAENVTIERNTIAVAVPVRAEQRDEPYDPLPSISNAPEPVAVDHKDAQYEVCRAQQSAVADALADLDETELSKLKEAEEARLRHSLDWDDFDPAYDMRNMRFYSGDNRMKTAVTQHEAVRVHQGRLAAMRAAKADPFLFADDDDFADAYDAWNEVSQSWALHYGHLDPYDGDRVNIEALVENEPENDDDARLRAVIAAQYEMTQEWLRNNGIDRLVVHRGMGWQEDADDYDRDLSRVPSWTEPGAQRITKHAGVSSWTIDPEVAEHFASEFQGEDTDLAVVATVEVPAERVLSFPGVGGISALSEGEVVLVTGPDFDAHVRRL